MTISVRERGIFVEIEGTPGTPETLVGADAVQVQNLTFNPIENVRMIEREIIRSSLNPEQAVYGGALMGFQFDVEVKGSGTAGIAPRFGDLLRACGMEETIVGATSVTYNPISDLSSHEACTIGYREGGNYRIATGCMGSVSLNATVGEYARLTFNMMGRISSESVASAPTASFESTVPPAFKGATFTIAGTAYPIEALSLDVQNNVAVRPDPNDANGYQLPVITARNSQGTMNPEAQLISAEDFVGDLRAGTSIAILTGTIGGTAGNIWSLSIPQAYYREISQGDREELLTWEIGFGAADTDGTDDFSLQMT